MIIIQRVFPVGHSMFSYIRGTKLYIVENTLTLIPAGTYSAKPYNSPDHNGMRVLLFNVPGREGIEFHPANWWDQLKGCLAPGKTIDWIFRESTQRYEVGVTDSDDTFNGFMAQYAPEGTPQITFTILDPLGVIT